MTNLFPMKGPVRRLMCLLDGGQLTDLVAYADGSFGIIRESEVLSVWESDELEACMGAFLRIAPPVKPLLVMRQLLGESDAPAARCKPMFYN